MSDISGIIFKYCRALINGTQVADKSGFYIGEFRVETPGGDPHELRRTLLD